MDSGKRVLLVAPDDGATATYLEKAFRSIGWHAKIWDYRAHAQQVGSNRVGVKFTFDIGAASPDLVLVLKGELLPVEAIRRVASHFPVALWHFDPREGKDAWVVERAKAASAFFTIGKGLVPFYEAAGVNASWLLEAADPDLHRPVDVKEKRYPVSFIGTVEVPGRVDWLNAVNKKVQSGIDVWGSFPANCPPRHHGRAFGDDGFSSVVSHSLVNLGRDRNPEIERSYGARLFRTLAAGGFLVTNRTIGICDDFQGCVALYRDDDECVQCVNYWLEHPEKAAAVAAKGRKLVLREHLFIHRVEEMIRRMKV